MVADEESPNRRLILAADAAANAGPSASASAPRGSEQAAPDEGYVLAHGFKIFLESVGRQNNGLKFDQRRAEEPALRPWRYFKEKDLLNAFFQGQHRRESL